MNSRFLSLFKSKRFAKTNPSEEKKLLPYQPDNLEDIISWVKFDNHTKYIFRSGPQIVKAPPEIVWDEAVLKINRYYEFSNGSITARINGEIEPGKTVKLKLYKDKFIGNFIPEVTATVFVAEKVNDHFIIGWGVKLPFGKTTERYLVLSPVNEDETQLDIADKIPGLFGFFTNLTLKRKIENAFKDLNAGFKNEVESPKLTK